MSEREISKAFDLISEIIIAEGNYPLRDKTWERRIDESWEVAVNGTFDDVEFKSEDGMKVNCPPFHAAIFFNGFLAGLLNPFEGTIVVGEAANEDTLIEALKEKLVEVIGSDSTS